jgi:hypothetical protein
VNRIYPTIQCSGSQFQHPVNGVDKTPHCTARPKPRRGFTDGFTQLCRRSRVLRPSPFKFLTYLADLPEVRFAGGFTSDSVKQIGLDYGVSYPTARRLMKILETTTVPGFNHAFVTRVDGRRYVIGRDGECRVPAELLAPVVKNDRASDQNRALPGGTSHYIEPARLSHSEIKNQKELPNSETHERERLVKAMAPTSAEASPEIPAPTAPPAAPPAPAHAQAVEPQVTPHVASWASTTGPKPKAKLTDEQRTLAVLTPEEQVIFLALSLVPRAKLAREFAYNPTNPGAKIALQRDLKASAIAAPPIPADLPTGELVRVMATRNDAQLPGRVAQRITNQFKDPQYLAGRELLLTAVWRGTVDAGTVAWAYEYVTTKMTKTHVRSPGALFWRIVREKTGIRGEDLRRLAKGG